jgi:RHS repeat-associated protein
MSLGQLVVRSLGAVFVSGWWVASIASAQQSTVVRRVPVGPAVRPLACVQGDSTCTTYPPTLSLSPGSETVSLQTLTIMATACDSIALQAVHILINGVDSTTRLTESGTSSDGCHVGQQYTGAIALVPGSNTVSLIAEGGASGSYITDTLTSVYTFVQRSPAIVSVTARQTQLRLTASTSPDTAWFTVGNGGQSPDTVALTTRCSGANLGGGCTSTKGSPTVIAGGGVDTVGVVFATTTVGASNTVTLRATLSTDSLARDSAITDVVVGATHAFGIDVYSVTPISVRTPDECLAFDVTRGAAYECGDLRVVHPLPAVRTFDKTKIPTLVYNSQLAHPHPVVAAVVELNGARGTPDSVVASVKNGSGATLGSTHFDGTAAAPFGSGTPRRVAVGWDGYGTATSENSWTFSVQAYYGTVDTVYTETFYYAVVNNQYSHLGAGWSLAGLESLTLYSNRSSFVWSSGDGEARYYQQVSGQPNVYATTNLARPDTIKFDSTASGWYFVRYAPHGTQVVFDSIGRHFQTIDRVGRTTTFTYGGAFGTNPYDLSTIQLPTGTTTPLTYTFVYHQSGMDSLYLDSIVAPVTGYPRVVWITHNSLHEVTSIKDPDTDSVAYTWEPEYYVMASRTDKRGTVTQFAYDGGRRLASATIDPGSSPHLAITTSFQAEESQGLVAPVQPESASTFVQGPRLAGDSSRYWVDKYGEPFRVRDGLGDETDLQRTNATYAVLVTRLHTPAGQITGAGYDSRGNDSTVTDSTTYIGGQYATTSYLFNHVFDLDTLTTLPAGETIHDSLDASGNVLWTQDGRGPVSRTTLYGYLNCLGMPDSLTQPITHAEHLTYGLYCNTQYDKSPMGYYTQYTLDGYGRVTEVTTPIDSADTSLVGVDSTKGAKDTAYTVYTRQREYRSYTYDAMDRVLQATHTADDSVTPHATEVVTAYDPEGLVLSVDRIDEDPSPNPDLHTATVYDAAGRAVTDTAVNKAVTTRIFDPAGNVTTLVTRRGYTITSTYDPLNRLSTKVVPSFTSAQIDSGMPVSSQDSAARNYMVNFVPSVAQPYGGTVIHGDTVSFTYDAGGRMIEADNVNAKISRAYFTNGKLQSETQRIRTTPDSGAAGSFAAHVYTIAYHYDLDGRRDSLYIPPVLAQTSTGNISQVQSYHYDSQTGWLRGVTDVMSTPYYFGYSVRGDPDTLLNESADSILYVRAYDDDGRQTVWNVTYPGTSQTALHAMTMTYDARGKMVGANDLAGLAGGSNTSMTYTSFGQVSFDMTNYGSGSTAGGAKEFFIYDSFGNILGDTTIHAIPQEAGYVPPPVKTSFAYSDTTGWLDSTVDLTAGTITYMYYDSSGNTQFSTMSVFANTPTMQDRASFYTAEERLAESDFRTLGTPTGKGANDQGPYNRVDERYRYDALGRRVWVDALKQCGYQGNLLGSGQNCENSLVRRTIWDGQQELAEIQAPASDSERDVGVDTLPYTALDAAESSNNQDDNAFFGQVVYTNGPTVDQPLSVIRLNYLDVHSATGATATPLLWQPLDIALYWSIYGHYEYMTVFCNGTRCTSGNLNYGFLQAYNNIPAFGVTSWLGTQPEEKLDQAQTQYRRARAYDPQTGRFTQEDPIGLAGGINAYGFVNGDPVNYADPFGLCPVPSNCTQAGYGVAKPSAMKEFEAGSACGQGTACPTAESAPQSLAYRIGYDVGAYTAILTGSALDGLDPQGGPDQLPSRSSAFNSAKDANGIPTSQQAKQQYMTRDANTGKSLRTWDYTNSNGESITIREDRARTYPDGGQQGPHFNAGPTGAKLDQHYYFNPNQ